MAARYEPIDGANARNDENDENNAVSPNLENPAEQDSFIQHDRTDSQLSHYDDDVGEPNLDGIKVSQPPFEDAPSYSSAPYSPRLGRIPESPARPVFHDTTYDSRKSTYTLQGLELEAASAKGLNDSQIPFHRKRQLWRLLRGGFIRFLISAALVGSLYAIFIVYSKKPSLDHTQKHIFNFLVTAGSMMLGTNLASAFTAVAMSNRWWILSRRKRHLSEIESILGCSSQTETAALALRVLNKRPAVAFYCVLWIVVNLAVQAVVAMLGLNYTVGGNIDTGVHVPGLVEFTNLTQYYYEPGQSESTSADQFTAHIYGDFSSYFYFESINDTANYSLPVTPFTSSTASLAFQAPSYSQYVFSDMPYNSRNDNTFFSNRSIITTSKCSSYDIVQGGNGSSGTITYTSDGEIQIANFSLFSPKSTTYSTVSNVTCGPRCAWLSIIENDGDSGYFYMCQVNVSSVFNTTYYEQQLSDRMAKLAAESIAYQGYLEPGAEMQEQRYPDAFYLGRYLKGKTAFMESRLRQYSIGVIMSADNYNPNVDPPVMGDVPVGASQLSLDNPGNIRGILFGVLGAHFVIFIVGAVLANRVVVIDDSYLAIARVLRPVVEKLGTQGSLLNGDEVCERLGDPKMAYGPSMKQENDGSGRILRHLEISEVAEVERRYAGWDGKYD